jgi:hypothetical protein
MTKTPTRKTDDAVVAVANRSSKALANLRAIDSDVARRAYDLYLSRGREHGHDAEDWLQAERELREPPSADATLAP